MLNVQGKQRGLAAAPHARYHLNQRLFAPPHKPVKIFSSLYQNIHLASLYSLTGNITPPCGLFAALLLYRRLARLNNAAVPLPNMAAKIRASSM
jgi:hypothetical protein